MKSVALTSGLFDYIEKMSIPNDPLMKELLDDTEKLGIPMIQVSSDQARFLYLLAKLVNAKNALEIGTLTGFSGMHIARGLQEGGCLTSVDIDPGHSAVANRYFQKAGLSERADLVTGPALDVMKRLVSEGRKFDLIFIDADKTNYRNYFEEALRLSVSGTVIILDNVLKGGRVIDESESDPDLDAIREINLALSTDGRVECLIMTIGDGFSLCRVR